MNIITPEFDRNDTYDTLTMQEAMRQMNMLSKAFTVVRLLKGCELCSEPCEECPTAENGECCYSFWNKNEICKNCTSRKALKDKKEHTKLEFLGTDIYQVISKYIDIDGEPYIMELIKALDEDSLEGIEDSEKLISKLNKYHRELYIDALTGAYNRRYYEDELKRSRVSAGVAMIDLDDFKLYNDTCGHDVGDAVLEMIVNTIKGAIRSTDILVRYGGDEFLLLMPDVDEETFSRILHRIQRRVNNTDVPEYSKIHLSVSIGGVVTSDETLEEAIVRADKLMYQAKNTKNAVITEHDFEQPKCEDNRQEILIVDDSEMNREILSAMLGDEFKIHQAANGEECLSLLSRYGTGISLVLLDIVMPVMDGFEVLEAMTSEHWIEDIPVIMISSEDSDLSIRRAYELGVSDYISRPFDAKVVYQRVHNTIKLYAKQRRLVNLVTDQIFEKEKNNRMMIAILSHIVEFRNGESGSHVLNINTLTEMLLRRLAQVTDKYDAEIADTALITTASSLHDIGKIGIDEKILNKPGKLTKEEFEVMKTHTVIGEGMLKKLDVYQNEKLIKIAEQICRSHHEKYDGRGYPDGLVGDEIPIAAQVVSIADVYDALVSERVYKKAYTHEQAIQMIFNGECGAFNPILLNCLRDIEDKIQHI